MHTPKQVKEFEVCARERRTFGGGDETSFTRTACFFGTENECRAQATRLQNSFDSLKERGLTITNLFLTYFVRETGRLIDAE